MDDTIEKVLSKMDGLESKIEDLTTTEKQNKGVDESLDKIEGHIRGLKYKVDELSLTIQDQKKTNDKHDNQKDFNEKMDTKLRDIEILLQGQSQKLEQLVIDTKNLGGEMQLHIATSSKNATGTGRPLV